MSATRRRAWLAAGAAASAGLALLALTVAGLALLPDRLPPATAHAAPARVLTRDGTVLNRSYAGRWNVHDRVALHRVPALLRDAVLAAEDRRFHSHGGADWIARAAAAWQNLAAGRVVRGASTISEQVARMLWPRPRTLWSRWLEGFDAARLERRFGKPALLAFYLNQVPYADRRRGVVQAAHHWFDRDLDTLSVRETLTLAVLVRAPSRLDPRRAPGAADAAVARLARHLERTGRLRPGALGTGPLALAAPSLELHAPHLVRRALATAPAGAARVRTTVDADTQRTAQALLEERLRVLAPRGAAHAAALVADHRDGAIRAWAVASAPGHAGSWLDAVTVPRQPGSTLKPFVYALALERGWTAATLIDDTPFAQSVGTGQHAYRNYSRVHHGAVSVREALGSSLNVPAVKALAFVGAAEALERLRALGLASLDRAPDVYGDGLALGNGEVSLLELAGAYAALASGGRVRPLRLHADAPPALARAVLDPAASRVVADILADPQARRLEFGSGGVLALPTPTAVKTGTSSDHRDAWAAGFDHRHVVAVWMGDLADAPMDRVSGASGPALVMRALFARLNRDGETRALPLHPSLRRAAVCRDDGGPARAGCTRIAGEWFLPGHPPRAAPAAAPPAAPRIRQPGDGLRLAIDPRLPRAAQRLRFALAPGPRPQAVDWFVDGAHVARSRGPQWLWTLAPGMHALHAVVHDDAGARRTPQVRFEVR